MTAESASGEELRGRTARWRAELQKRLEVRRRQRPGFVGDPEERKVLERVYHDCREADRLEDMDRLGENGRAAFIRLLDSHDPQRLGLDGALQLLDGLDHVLVEHGDLDLLCRQAELVLAQGTTTLLAWKKMYPDVVPAAVTAYRAGMSEIPKEDIEALRNMLSAFLHTRSYEYGVHKARLRMKRELLRRVGAVLGVLVLGLAAVVASEPADMVAQVAAVVLAGAIGATMSGAFKLRDTIARGSELREFRPAMFVQMVVGAASALFLFVVIESGFLQGTWTDDWPGRVGLGFVAGFSEPFTLGLVVKVAGTMRGDVPGAEDEQPGAAPAT